MRIFAFGCSLTQYFYPTWADILIHQYKSQGYEGSNWAKSGAGNMYINSRLWEANTIHKFTKDDVILLQWASMYREDRYHMGKGWWTPGNFSRYTVQSDNPFVLNNFNEDELENIFNQIPANKMGNSSNFIIFSFLKNFLMCLCIELKISNFNAPEIVSLFINSLNDRLGL